MRNRAQPLALRTRLFASITGFAFLFSLAAPVTQGHAAEIPEECQNIAKFEAKIKQANLGARTYTTVCKNILKDLEKADAAKTKIEENPQMDEIDTSGESQSELVQGVADHSAKVAEVQAQRKQAADAVASDYAGIHKKIEKQANQMLSDTARLSGAQQAQLEGIGVSATQDLIALKDRAKKGYSSATALSAGLGQTETKFREMQAQSQQNADNLKGGSLTSGVSKGTWVALGGAALIAAGTVGALYYMSNRTVDKLDSMANQKIKKFENTAKDVIKDAEKTFKKLIIFATKQGEKMLDSIEDTAKRIMNEARKDGEAFIDKIKSDLVDEFPNLSIKGLERLRSDMDEVFANLLVEAELVGDDALVAKLKKAKKEVLELIDAEIKKQKDKTNTGTNTGTGTGTGTGTNTGTNTNTNTNTNTGTNTVTDTNTQTNTNTATLTVTQTGTSTGTATTFVPPPPIYLKPQ